MIYFGKQKLMKYISVILLLSSVISCKQQEDNKSINIESTKKEEMTPLRISKDSINTSFPVQIENEKGFIKIFGQRQFKNNQLISSNFTISIADIPKYLLVQNIEKESFKISDTDLKKTDTINMNNFVIKNIKFEFVRANTLYFNAVLQNPLNKREIVGRFNLFYQTNKKGRVYGWIVDEIRAATTTNN